MPYLVERDDVPAHNIYYIDPNRSLKDVFWLLGNHEAISETDKRSIPKTLKVTSPKAGILPHVFGDTMGPWIISPSVKTILERCGEHENHFFEIELNVERTDNKATQSGNSHYVILQVSSLADAVLIDETDFWADPNPTRGKKAFEGSRGVIRRLGQIGLRADAIRGKHFWRGGDGPVGNRQPFYNRFFCSDEFYQAFHEQHLTGIQFRKCTLF